MALTKATLIDLNSNELILDLDADTSITADTDDTIHFKIAGSDEITMTATAFAPSTSDGQALGTSSLMFADLFLASGSVINFNNGDVTLTHSSNALTLGGGALTVDDVAIDGKVITMTGSTDDTFVTTVAANGATSLVTTDTAAAAANLTITADGTVGINSTGDMTLDSSTDIILDAAGGDIVFKVNGTQIGNLGSASSNFLLTAGVQDKDIQFRGNDGGADLTALTLDMSAAGAATFNDKITAVGTSVFTNLDISGDVDIDGTTNLDVVDIDGAVDMASTLGVAGVVTANAGVVIDNITIDGTEIDVSSGGLTIDVATNITLDADGGNIEFSDDGTGFANFTNTSGNLIIKSGTTTAATFSGANVTFAGTVGSGAITSTGIVTGTGFTAGNAVLAEAELELLDGLTAGTAIASKVVTTDASIDTSGQRNLTISGELDAATLDISGDIDIAGASIFHGSVVLNESSADVDLRVESNGNTHMLFVDGGNDRVGIGGTGASFGQLGVENAGDAQIDLFSNVGSGSEGKAEIFFSSDSSSDHVSMASIVMQQDGAGDRKGEMLFNVSDNGGPGLALKIENNKMVTVSNGFTLANGDVVLASGHGIDFSATADSGATGATDSSEILKDYEEGDWTPASNNLGFATVHAAKYIKIGEFVSVYCDITRNSSPSDTSQGSSFSGMPFNAGDDYPNGFSTCGNVTEAVRTSASGASMSLTGLDGVPLTRSQLAGNRCQHYVTFNTL